MVSSRQRLFDFAQKTCNRYLHDKKTKVLTQASCLPTKFLLDDTQNDELRGAENAADGVTAGVSQDSYASVYLPLFSYAYDRPINKDVTKYYEYDGFTKEYPRSNQTRDCSADNDLPPNRSFVKYQRAYRPQNRHLCWRRGRLVHIRGYRGNGPQSEPFYKTRTGYYDILEVIPTATQAQIKTAYYKQSFVYHPDRNSDSEVATARFFEINEAYTVLGNKALRKKYDRGLLSQSDLVGASTPSSNPTAGRSEKHQKDGRRSMMDTHGRKRIFDFDTFFKAHYQEQLQRDQDIRVRKEELLKKQKEAIDEKKLDRMMEMVIGCMLALVAALLISVKRGWWMDRGGNFGNI